MPKKSPSAKTPARRRRLNKRGKVELKPPSKQPQKKLTEVKVAGGHMMKLGDVGATDAKLHGSIERIFADGTVTFKLGAFEQEAGAELRIDASLVHPSSLPKSVFRK